MRTEVRSYTPLPHQKAFHESNAMFRAYIGGFGAGKTMAGVWEAIDVSMAYPRNVGLIARRTYRELLDSTAKLFLDVCPRELIKNYSKREEKVEFVNGSVVLFRSLDDVEKFRSLNLGWWYIDEASEVHDEDIPNKLIGRLRLPVPWRGAWVTSNPPHFDHWLYRWCKRAETNPRYFYVRASTYENPHLPPEYVETLEQEYGPQWAARFLRGEFGSIAPGNAVYDAFNYDLHVVPDIKWDPSRAVVRAWDFGRHRPAVLFSQLGPDRQWRILYEMMGHWVLIRDWAEKVVTTSNEMFPGASFIDVGDPAGAQRGDKEERSSVEILWQEFGIKVVTRRYPKKRLVELVNQKLATVRKGKDGVLVPAVIISKAGCPVLIDGFAGGYSWPKDRGGRVRKDLPVEDGYFEHLQDCAQYTAGALFLGGVSDSYGAKIATPTWRFS